MPFTVYCDMSDKNGVGVTVISHDSEGRTHVKGCEGGRMLLTQHSLHWSESVSIGQSYQCLLTLRAVYQV